MSKLRRTVLFFAHGKEASVTIASCYDRRPKPMYLRTPRRGHQIDFSIFGRRTKYRHFVAKTSQRASEAPFYLSPPLLTSSPPLLTLTIIQISPFAFNANLRTRGIVVDDFLAIDFANPSKQMAVVFDSRSHLLHDAGISGIAFAKRRVLSKLGWDLGVINVNDFELACAQSDDVREIVGSCFKILKKTTTQTPQGTYRAKPGRLARKPGEERNDESFEHP